MSDLDFDELDKAVNSLMNDRNEPQASPSPAAIATPTAPATEPQVSTSYPAAVTGNSPAPTPSVVKPTTRTARPEVSSLAIKRRGQFMDVMHPSADMTTPSMQPRPAARVSRTGAGIEPQNPDVTPEPLTPRPPQAAPREAMSAPVSASSPEDSDVMPDPIDLAAAEHQSETEPPSGQNSVAKAAPKVDLAAELGLGLDESPSDHEEADGATEVQPVESHDSTEPQAPDAPLSTPFLAGAKVEKRPLGSATPTGQSAAEEPALALTNTAEASSASDEPSMQTLPAELQSSVMEVESDSVATSNESAQALNASQAPSPAATEVSSQTPAAPTPVEEPAGPSSIPPQYKTATPKVAQHPTEKSIYDSVDQPVAAKKNSHRKSSWMILGGFMLFVIIGCVIGAALYLWLNRA